MTDLDMRYANLPPISGGSDNTDPPEDPPVDPPVGDPPADPPKPTGKPEFSDEQQLHVNSIVKRAEENAVKAALKAITDEQEKKDKAEALEREKTAKKLLGQQGKLQELNELLTGENEKLQAEVDRLNTELADFHSDIETEYSTFRETMPSALSVFDVGEEATPSAKRDFVAKGRKMIDDLGAPYRPGNAPSPEPRVPVAIPGGGSGDDASVREEAQTLIKTDRRYNRF